MNILFISEKPILPNHGGIERVSIILANQFKAKGHSSFFLTTDTNYKPTGEEEFPNLSIDTSTNNYLLEFKNILINNHIDIIINQFVSNNTLCLLPVAKREGVKIMTVLHNRPYATVGMERRYKRLTRPETLKGWISKVITLIYPNYYRRINFIGNQTIYTYASNISDRFVLLSDKFIPRFFKYTPNVPQDKIIAINNPNTFSTNIENIKEKENIILWVGRLADPQKNVKDVINCWNHFYKTHQDWKAIIIGDGPHKAYFEKYAKNKHTKNIMFCGNRNDVDNFYKTAKFFCMTSLYEGWPMVLAESMAHGCIPAIYDTFESCNEIIDDGISGIISEPFQPITLANRISEIADNEQKRILIANNCKNHISKFNANDISDIWLSHIKSILNTQTDK